MSFAKELGREMAKSSCSGKGGGGGGSKPMSMKPKKKKKPAVKEAGLFDFLRSLVGGGGVSTAAPAISARTPVTAGSASARQQSGYAYLQGLQNAKRRRHRIATQNQRLALNPAFAKATGKAIPAGSDPNRFGQQVEFGVSGGGL